MAKTKNRPPRLYTDSKGRYVKLGGKKIYIKSNINNTQLVKVVLNNFRKYPKKKKKRKDKKGYLDKSEYDKLTGSYSTSTDLAKILFHQTLNKKDEEDKNKLAIKNEEDKKKKTYENQQSLLQDQSNQIMHLQNYINTLPPRVQYLKGKDSHGREVYGTAYVPRDLQINAGRVFTKATDERQRYKTDAEYERVKREESEKQKAETEERLNQLVGKSEHYKSLVRQIEQHKYEFNKLDREYQRLKEESEKYENESRELNSIGMYKLTVGQNKKKKIIRRYQ